MKILLFLATLTLSTLGSLVTANLGGFRHLADNKQEVAADAALAAESLTDSWRIDGNADVQGPAAGTSTFTIAFDHGTPSSTPNQNQLDTSFELYYKVGDPATMPAENACYSKGGTKLTSTADLTGIKQGFIAGDNELELTLNEDISSNSKVFWKVPNDPNSGYVTMCVKFNLLAIMSTNVKQVVNFREVALRIKYGIDPGFDMTMDTIVDLDPDKEDINLAFALVAGVCSTHTGGSINVGEPVSICVCTDNEDYSLISTTGVDWMFFNVGTTQRQEVILGGGAVRTAITNNPKCASYSGVMPPPMDKVSCCKVETLIVQDLFPTTTSQQVVEVDVLGQAKIEFGIPSSQATPVSASTSGLDFTDIKAKLNANRRALAEGEEPAEELTDEEKTFATSFSMMHGDDDHDDAVKPMNMALALLLGLFVVAVAGVL